MILENYAFGGASDETFEDYSMPGVIGDMSELPELMAEHASAMHNLTIALARFEHKCIVENVAPEILEEGINEFFAKAKGKIVTWWKQFIAWLKGIWDRLRTAVFGPRKDWLKDHIGELGRMSSFNGAKAKVGKNLGGGFEKIVASIGSVNLVSSIAGYEKSSSMTDDALKKELVGKFVGGNPKSEQTVSAYLEDSLIGAQEETEISKALVAKLLQVVESTNKMVEDIPALIKKAEMAMKVAENAANTALGESALFEADSDYEKNFPKAGSKVGKREDEPGYQKPSDKTAHPLGDEKAFSRGPGRTGEQNKAHQELSRRRLAAVRIFGEVMQSATSAALSIGSKANGMAMSALVKAYHAGKQSAAKNEGGLLAEFGA